MTRSGGDADPVTGFAQHLDHLIPEVKAEQALTLHEKAHFVFAVGVFTQEFLAQIGTVRMIRLDANGINGGVGPSRLGSWMSGL